MDAQRKVHNCLPGNAFNRMITLGATFSPKTAGSGTTGLNITGVGKGYALTGWECRVWVSGDGNNTFADQACGYLCR